MRCILDTSVLVAGLRSKSGASARVLFEVAEGRVQLIASPAVFLEYEAVLKREKHGLNSDAVDGFLAELASILDPVEIRFVWRPLLTDPGDEMLIEAAINGRAESIVTHNRRHFEKAGARFGMQVWSPAQLLEALQAERRIL
jgi:putative PIN family toxin of toxin-antitoxin system